MDIEEIDRTIARLPYWHYQFNLKGRQTPIWREGHENHHEERRRHFFDPLVEFLGAPCAASGCSTWAATPA